MKAKRGRDRLFDPGFAGVGGDGRRRPARTARGMEFADWVRAMAPQKAPQAIPAAQVAK
jgi:hypothetical protein